MQRYVDDVQARIRGAVNRPMAESAVNGGGNKAAAGDYVNSPERRAHVRAYMANRRAALRNTGDA